MVRRTSAVGSALLGTLLFAVQMAPDVVGDWLLDGDGGWLPQFDSVGQTVLVYSYLFRGFSFVLGIVALFALGYWAGTRLDLESEYQQFTLAVGGGGSVGYLVAGLTGVVVLGGGLPTFDSFTVGVLVSMVGTPLGVGVQFAVVAFAGAAFVHVTGASGDVSSDRRADDGPADVATD